MKKLPLLFLILLCAKTALPQDCGGMVPGMNISAATTSCIKGSFYRPEVPEKFRSNPNVIEYEKNFVITYKPYFTQGDPEKFKQWVDTSEKRDGRTVIGNEQQAFFENTGLLPGVSYNVCVYTSCNGKLFGPLCNNTTTTLEPPYIIERDTLSSIPGAYFFIPKPKTNVIADDIILEYRADDSAEWTIMHPNPSGFIIRDMKPGHVYFAKYKVVYRHGTESSWSDEIIIKI